MGLPEWMTDPEHSDDRDRPRKPLPPTDAWTGIDFEGVFPTREEATEQYRAQFVDAPPVPRSTSVALGVFAAVCVVLAAGAWFVTALPVGLRVCLSLSLLLTPALMAWVRLAPASVATVLGWIDGAGPRKPRD